MNLSPELLGASSLAISLVGLILLIIVILRLSTIATLRQTVVDSSERTERTLRDETSHARSEASEAARTLREEIAASFKNLADNVRNNMSDLAENQKARFDSFESVLSKSKEESASAAGTLRQEVTNTLTQLGTAMRQVIADLAQAQTQKLDEVTKRIAGLTESHDKRQKELQNTIDTNFVDIRTAAAESSGLLKDEVAKSLKSFAEVLKDTLNNLSETQRERLSQVTSSVGQLTDQQKQQQELLREMVEGRLETMRKDNTEKLEQMRQTVDEKLTGTLEQRLGESFKLVSGQLEQVYKGIGEMQNLATGVGDLKRVLSNVRARGAWGEVILATLLEQVMAPEQYSANVEVIPGSSRRVEFAIKLPGQSEEDGPLWLPIDSKFPHDAYDRLAKAAEEGNAEAVEAAGWELETQIKSAARGIAEKYISPPHSTDFGVMFLPTEGLYAEVIRRSNLVDWMHQNCRVSVSGPTTLAALLSSLRMGFRTLAIQKRSSEVWKVLGAVKTEFGNYAKVMEKVKIKLTQATNEIENVAVRQRAIDRKLRGIESISEADAVSVLALPTSPEELVAEEVD